MVSVTDRIMRYSEFLSEKGRADLAGAVAAWRVQGDTWLEEFKAVEPELAELVDLIANYDFPDAFDRLKEMADEWIDGEPNVFKRMGLRTAKDFTLDKARPDIEKLHVLVRAEIDRPRF